MAFIELDRVHVDLPVYSGIHRSLKRSVIDFGIAGAIGTDRHNRVIVHALRDISLSIHDGDRIGLIGRNGSGKSTLLRAISGIVEPTTGYISSSGKISTLFNVDSIMDPEMSGYDNIMLSGSLLGIAPKDMENCLPDIEEFTELGEYLALPVRTYSAGMRVRLGFALSTLIEPEILLLDEAIGAGDAHFLEKAKQRALSFYEKSAILVIATHSPEILKDMCNKAVLLDHGSIVAIGPVEETLTIYRALYHG